MENIAQNIFRLTMPYKDIYTTVLIIKTPHGAVLFDTATYREDVGNTIYRLFSCQRIWTSLEECAIIQ